VDRAGPAPVASAAEWGRLAPRGVVRPVCLQTGPSGKTGDPAVAGLLAAAMEPNPLADASLACRACRSGHPLCRCWTGLPGRRTRGTPLSGCWTGLPGRRKPSTPLSGCWTGLPGRRTRGNPLSGCWTGLPGRRKPSTPVPRKLDRLAGLADVGRPAEWMLDRLAGLADTKRLPLQGPSGRRVRRPVMKSRGSLLLRWL